jgi:hypothetical protein
MKLFHATLLLGAAIGVWGAALEHGEFNSTSQKTSYLTNESLQKDLRTFSSRRACPSERVFRTAASVTRSGRVNTADGAMPSHTSGNRGRGSLTFSSATRRVAVAGMGSQTSVRRTPGTIGVPSDGSTTVRIFDD